MLNALRFVSGAVSKLDTVPALSHYRVEAGFIMGFNGTVAICSPIDLALTATPNAEQFYRALKSCDEVVTITQTHSGSLRVKSGTFSAVVDCLPDAYPAVAPDGAAYAVKPGMGALLKKLVPIISNDPMKLWANGALFSTDGTITVTDGVVMAQAYTGDYMPGVCNVPAVALREVVRTGLDPVALQFGAQSLTFHFDGGKWLRTTLFNAAWPLHKLDGILGRAAQPVAIPDGYFASVEKLIPFGDDFAKLAFDPAGFHMEDGDKQQRARVDMQVQEGAAGVYNARLLLKIKDLAKWIDFSQYPSAALWSGDNVRGAIMPMVTK
jgi:hypothetical protein